ncbi:MAG: TldD/PmbA family protein [Candidatus Bathyarchaeota archaeon]|nr:MAG: TldD/PmbA family protein [Candidatus Bathyarchaeota archaeon]
MNNFELCKKAVEWAMNTGVKEAEALVVSNRSTGVEIERAEIKTCTNTRDMGIAIRAVTDGKVGFAYTNMLTKEEEVKKTALQAAKASAASPKDKNWKRLPERKNYPTISDTFDKRITEFTSDEAVVLCQKMMESAVNVDKKVLPAFGGTEVIVQEIMCANSLGVEVEDKGTALFCGLGTMARSETQVSPMCFEFKASRTYTPEPDWVGGEAAKLAVNSINVGKAQAGKFPILLDPFALQSILMHTLIPSIKGDIVSRGRSILKDKVGEKVTEDNITISDDGTLSGGLHSGKTDMEGVPKQKTPIIEDGVLQNFLYDNYWAKLEGKESTGNASRGGGGLTLPPYGTLPTINPSNIMFKTGTASEEELITETKNGYYVRNVQGAHQSNPETGEFSVALAPAWRILRGEIVHAVKGVMIAGNAYNMIKNISVLGEKARQLNMFIAPKVIVSELSVITK